MYILLANLSVDWSYGEYRARKLDNLYLGNGLFDTDLDAEKEAEKLLFELSIKDDSIQLEKSTTFFKKVY